jgi:epoxyqueuosine reductase QueG
MIDVKQYGIEAGADIVGVASSKDFSSAPEGFRPEDVLPGCLSVIVLGAVHPHDALGSIPEYTAARNESLSKMTDIAKKVEKRIKAGGFAAKAISASGGKTIDGNHYGHISLKHAAELAGLGIITRNYLLTSPEYGNLLWLSAVLTNADLISDERVKESFCDGCNICVETCPMGALDVPGSVNKKECAKNFKIENKKFVIKCFSCRTVCPHSKC